MNIFKKTLNSSECTRPTQIKNVNLQTFGKNITGSLKPRGRTIFPKNKENKIDYFNDKDIKNFKYNKIEKKDNKSESQKNLKKEQNIKKEYNNQLNTKKNFKKKVKKKLYESLDPKKTNINNKSINQIVKEVRQPKNDDFYTFKTSSNFTFQMPPKAGLTFLIENFPEFMIDNVAAHRLIISIDMESNLALLTYSFTNRNKQFVNRGSVMHPLNGKYSVDLNSFGVRLNLSQIAWIVNNGIKVDVKLPHHFIRDGELFRILWKNKDFRDFWTDYQRMGVQSPLGINAFLYYFCEIFLKIPGVKDERLKDAPALMTQLLTKIKNLPTLTNPEKDLWLKKWGYFLKLEAFTKNIKNDINTVFNNKKIENWVFFGFNKLQELNEKWDPRLTLKANLEKIGLREYFPFDKLWANNNLISNENNDLWSRNPMMPTAQQLTFQKNKTLKNNLKNSNVPQQDNDDKE